MRSNVTALVAAEVLAIAEGNAACAHLLSLFRDGTITATIEDDGELRWSMIENHKLDAAAALMRANAVITSHKASDQRGGR